MCSATFFFENRVFYEIMWKNIVERGRPQMSIWCMRIACRIPKATNTHSSCVILIAFPKMIARTRLNDTLYVHCLSCYIIYRPRNTNFALLCTRSLTSIILKDPFKRCEFPWFSTVNPRSSYANSHPTATPIGCRKIVQFTWSICPVLELVVAVLVSINPLKTKRILLNLKTQSVPRCKHFSSRL